MKARDIKKGDRFRYSGDLWHVAQQDAEPSANPLFDGEVTIYSVNEEGLPSTWLTLPDCEFESPVVDPKFVLKRMLNRD